MRWDVQEEKPRGWHVREPCRESCALGVVGEMQEEGAEKSRPGQGGLRTMTKPLSRRVVTKVAGGGEEAL